MGTHTITIHRESKLSRCAVTYTVEIDGLIVGSLDDGGTISSEVTAGPHTVAFIHWRSVAKSIRIEVPEGSSGVYLVAKVAPSGRLDVSCCSSNPADQLSGHQYCHAPNSEPPAAEKKSRTRIAVIALAVVILFAATFGIIAYQRSRAFAGAEAAMTDDDKALALQNQARAGFESGDYKTGLDLCFEIVEKYPKTAVASLIKRFAQTQVSKYIHISASDLVAEYEANRVNADMLYENKVVVVSGTVYAIDKTNSGRTLSVLLFSDSLLRYVQLNLELSQEASVASLRQGDSISAIGKCTGLSGTVLLFFEGDNVMVSDCLIIEKP